MSASRRGDFLAQSVGFVARLDDALLKTCL